MITEDSSAGDDSPRSSSSGSGIGESPDPTFLAKLSHNPLINISSDKLRRSVWPVMLERTADAHLSLTERRKRKKAQHAAAAAALSGRSSSSSHDSRESSGGGAAAAAASSSSSSNVLVMMSIEECDERLSRMPGPGQSTKDMDAAAFPFPQQCCAQVVEVDVLRSLFDVPEGPLREALRLILKRTLLRVCAADPTLHYYQGMHDVATVVLHVYFDDLASRHGAAGLGPKSKKARRLEEQFAETMLQLASSRLRRFMTRSMTETQSLLIAMHGVLQQVSPRLAKLLERHQIGPSWNFALSWVITWCAHDVHSGEGNRKVMRTLFDFLALTNENMIVFFCISVLVHFCRIDTTSGDSLEGTTNSDSSSSGLRKRRRRDPFDTTSGDSPNQRQQQQQHLSDSPLTLSQVVLSGSLSLDDYDEARYGPLVSGCERVPEHVLGDFGMLHSFLKKLPAQITATDDESESAARLQRVLETAARIEKAHKGLLLHLLEDPSIRVALLPPLERELEFDPYGGAIAFMSSPLAQMSSRQVFGGGGKEDNASDGRNDDDDDNTISPTTSLVTRAVGGAVGGGLQLVVVLGAVASAYVAQYALQQQAKFG